MTTLRYLLSGLFVVSVAVGLLLMVHAETRRFGGESSWPGVAFAARPAVWFGSSVVLFVAIVILTILFPVGD